MAVKVGSVLLELKADTAKLVSGMDKAEKSIYRLKKSFSELLKAAAALYGIEKTFSMLDSMIIQTSAKFEKFSLILETLEGNSKKAEKDLEWIKNFAKSTPYEIDKVTEAFVKLKSYGFDAQKELKVLGDTAAALGKPLDMAVEAIADAVTGEFERLKEFGIKAYQQGQKVAFTWADASGRARYIVVNNNREVIENTVTAIWNSKYEGAMNKLSQSWDGIISNMKDAWTNFKADTAKLSFKKAEKDLLVLQNVWNDTLNDMKGPVSKIETAVVKGFKKIVLGAAIVDDGISDLMGLITHFSKGLLYSFDEFAYSIPAKIEKLINNIIDVINSSPDFIKKAFGGDLKHLTYFSDMSETYSQAAQNEFKKAWGYIGRIVRGEIGDTYKYWKNKFDEAEKETEETSKKIKKTHKEIGQIGQFNRSMLKDENDELNKQSNYMDYAERKLQEKVKSQKIINDLIKRENNLLADLTNQYNELFLTPQQQLDIWYKKEKEKINSTITDNKKLQDALFKLELIYQKKKQDLNDKFLKTFQTNYNKYIQENYKTFLTTLDNVKSTLNDDFFSFLTRKFHSSADFIKSLFRDVGHSIYNSLARNISDSLAGSITGGIQNMFIARAPENLGQMIMKLGLKSTKTGGFAGIVAGTQVLIDKNGNILQGADAISKKLATGNVFSLASTGKNLYDVVTLGPATQLANLSGFLASKGLGSLAQFTAGGSGWFTGLNPAGATGLYQAGSLATGALVGGGLGYGIGSLGDLLFHKQTKAGLFGAIGGAIGSLGGPVGALIGGGIGSLIGGMFGGKTRVTGRESGVDLNEATEDDVKGKYWSVTHYHKSGGWFHHGRSWNVWRYKTLDERTIENLKRTLQSFDVLMEEVTGVSKKIILHGRFKNIIDALNGQMVKEILHDISGEDNIRDIYNAWKNYAKSIHEATYKALQNEITKYISYTRNYKEWLLGFKGDTVGLAKYKYQVAQQDLQTIEKMIGSSAYGVTIDNYLEKYKEAIKQNLTPETLKLWQNLGDALKQVAETQKEYTNILKKQKDTVEALNNLSNPFVTGAFDMMLPKTNDATKVDVKDLAEQIKQGNTENKYLFYEILKELKKQTALQQGLPA